MQEPKSLLIPLFPSDGLLTKTHNMPMWKRAGAPKYQFTIPPRTFFLGQFSFSSLLHLHLEGWEGGHLCFLRAWDKWRFYCALQKFWYGIVFSLSYRNQPSSSGENWLYVLGPLESPILWVELQRAVEILVSLLPSSSPLLSQTWPQEKNYRSLVQRGTASPFLQF